MSNGFFCTVEFDATPGLKLDADIQKWSPFHLHFKLAHGRLLELDNLMESKKARGDDYALKYVEEERDRIINCLIGQAAVGVIIKLRRLRRQVDNVLTGIFVSSILLYLVRPIWYGLAADAALVSVLFATHRFFGGREEYTQQIVDNSFRRKNNG